MKTCVSMAGAIAVLLSTISCAAQARSPEPVPLDRVECSRCRMLISTDRGAGQVVSTEEDTRFYDDVGCLAADWVEQRNQATPYVRVYNSEWKDARKAVYANHTESRTAMGSGLVAFDTEEEARLVSPGSRILTWDDVVSDRGKQ